MKPSYDVQTRKRSWAVIRTGPKGGKRVVAVYVDQAVALHLAFTLNLNSENEL